MLLLKATGKLQVINKNFLLMSNIIVIAEITNFLRLIKPLALKKSVLCYFSYRDSEDKTKLTNKLIDFNNYKFDNLLTSEYDQFFFTTKEILNSKELSFYKDGFFEYSIECKGGRKNKNNAEVISIRTISKNPNVSIKSFFNLINTHLKKDSEFEQGIGKTANTKKIFYSKDFIKDYTIWYDLEKKVGPVLIEL